MGGVSETIQVVLLGRKETGQADPYQLLQEEVAVAEAAKAAVTVEIVFAPGFDHLRVIRKRLLDAGAPPLDAVIVEPGSVSSTGLILRELKERTGLVLLNAWSPEVEEYARGWGSGLPFGTVSTDHSRIGEIQGRQVAALLPAGGHVLCVTGPPRSSAAVERLQGMKSELRPDITLAETEAGQWTESAGIVAFESWYSLHKARSLTIDTIAAQSDDLAMGARSACGAVVSAAHRDVLLKARFLGVDACPLFGRKLVDSGELTASVTTPATTGEAIRGLQRFWKSGQPMPLRAVTEPKPYPPSSAGPPR
jgi:ABC-type sugar transport system substrate-binding protein